MQDFADTPWVCHSHTPFVPHRHYCLVLDIIGRSLTTFKSSYEMVTVDEMVLSVSIHDTVAEDKH
jgi:hypothetical protein